MRLSDWALEAIVDMRPSLRDDVAGLVALIKPITTFSVAMKMGRGTSGAIWLQNDSLSANIV